MEVHKEYKIHIGKFRKGSQRQVQQQEKLNEQKVDYAELKRRKSRSLTE